MSRTNGSSERADTPLWRRAETVCAIGDAAGGFLACYVWLTTGGLGGLGEGLFFGFLTVFMTHGMAYEVLDLD